MFTPEFRNRLDAVISFAPLSKDVIHQVVEKFVLQLEAQLMDRNVHIELSPEAAAWLGREGLRRPHGRASPRPRDPGDPQEALGRGAPLRQAPEGRRGPRGVKDDKLDLHYEAAQAPRIAGSKPPLLTAE
jgi:ATP-dependent Clp protease ATP-binding subunit ClpA